MVRNKHLKIPPWREILRRLPNARHDFNRMKPLQKFNYFYGIGRMAMLIPGFSIFAEDQRLYWYTFVIFGYSGTNFILMIYSIWRSISDGEPEKALLPTCLYVGPHIATLALILFFVTKKRHILHSLLEFGGRRIFLNFSDDIEYQRICSKHMDRSMKQFVVKMIMMTFGFSVGVSGPLYAFCFRGIRASTTSVRVPYTEEHSNIEFLVNNILQLLNATHGASLYLGLEVMMAIFKTIITIAPKLVEYKLKRLIHDYEQNRISELQLRRTFNDITKLCVDADRYAATVSDVLYLRTMITPVLFGYAIGVSIYCQYALFFVAGYGIAIMCWVQLFYICELGEDMQDAAFASVLYDSNWHILPLDIQKCIKLLIKRKQNPVILSIGPFGCNLNREMFKIITNKIYSFVMFLLNFIK